MKKECAKFTLCFLVLMLILLPLAIYSQEIETDNQESTEIYDYQRALDEGDVYGLLGRVYYWCDQAEQINQVLLKSNEELQVSQNLNLALTTQNNRLELENNRVRGENLLLNSRIDTLLNNKYKAGNLAFDITLGAGTSITAGLDFKVYLGAGLFGFIGLSGIYGHYMTIDSFLEPPYLLGIAGIGYSL